MQSVKTKDFVRMVEGYGYQPVRTKGSHTVYVRTVTDSIAVPTASSEINGCLAKKIEKHMQRFAACDTVVLG